VGVVAGHGIGRIYTDITIAIVIDITIAIRITEYVRRRRGSDDGSAGSGTRGRQPLSVGRNSIDEVRDGSVVTIIENKRSGALLLVRMSPLWWWLLMLRKRRGTFGPGNLLDGRCVAQTHHYLRSRRLWLCHHHR